MRLWLLLSRHVGLSRDLLGWLLFRGFRLRLKASLHSGCTLLLLLLGSLDATLLLLLAGLDGEADHFLLLAGGLVGFLLGDARHLEHKSHLLIISIHRRVLLLLGTLSDGGLYFDFFGA